MTRWRFLLAGSGALAAAVAAGDAQAATTLSLIGQVVIPSGTIAQGTVLGGLSGIDYDPATDSYTDRGPGFVRE